MIGKIKEIPESGKNIFETEKEIDKNKEKSEITIVNPDDTKKNAGASTTIPGPDDKKKNAAASTTTP